jgi:hypothetical protein
MSSKNGDLDIVSEFLIRFYHQEPDYLEATIRALKVLQDRHQYKWELATAFRSILESSLPTGTLKELVLLSANRYVQSDEEAREVLERIYQDNIFYAVVNFDELRD